MRNKKPLDEYDDEKYVKAYKKGYDEGYNTGYEHARIKAKVFIEFMKNDLLEKEIKPPCAPDEDLA